MTLFRFYFRFWFQFRFFLSLFCGAFACANAGISAGVAVSGTAGGDAGRLPAFLRGSDLYAPLAPRQPLAADVFFGGTNLISAPLTPPVMPGGKVGGGATGAGAAPSFFSFLPGTPSEASTSADARAAQAMLAGLAQSSTIAPRFHPGAGSGSGSGAKALADTAAADTELRDIVARQNEIFANADAAGDNLHPDDLQSQFQQLTQRYDKLLRVYPNYVAGLVAYGQLLNIIGMSKEGAALMSVADNLDGNIPLVKNELGNYCAEEGHPLIAFVFYTAAIQLAPREPFYYYQLGTLLTEARDTFLKDAPGMWTRDKIDEAMQASFRYAMDLAPGDWRYAYRYGLSYYDLGLKEWEDGLQFWQAFEKKLAPGFEQQVARLHQAKILIELRRPDDAQKLLDTVTHPLLAAQRAPVVAALNACKNSVAHPNPNIEITTGSADDPSPAKPAAEVLAAPVKSDPNLVVTRTSPPNRIVSRDDIDAAIARFRVGMTKDEVISMMQPVSSAYTVVNFGGTGTSRIYFRLDFWKDGNQQQLWVDMGGHDEGFRAIMIGNIEPKQP